MVNVYLFIELLRAASADAAMTELKKLELANCKLANVVALSDQKLAAQLDCDSSGDASRALLEKITPVQGIVQTNIIAVVRPEK